MKKKARGVAKVLGMGGGFGGGLGSERLKPRRCGEVWGRFCNMLVLSPHLADDDVFSGRLMNNGI